MKTVFLVFVLFIISLSSGASAYDKYIRLSDLIGTYYADTSITRTASFDLGAAPTIVRGAQIQITGGATVGVIKCPDDWSGTLREFPWPFTLVATMTDATTGGIWMVDGATTDEGGLFEILGGFKSYFQAGWGFLNDGKGEVVLRIEPLGHIAGCVPVVVPMFALVNDAYLILDADICVPVDTTTWGKIKALYESNR